MELDKALEFAVILAWKDLMTGDQPVSARVKYESKRGVPLDFLSVWRLRPGGYQDRVCDYRTSASATQPMGACFSNGYHSDKLAVVFDFIMKNQAEFTCPHDAWRPHFVTVQPPPAELVAEAVDWMSRVQAPAPGLGSVTKAKAVLRPRQGTSFVKVTRGLNGSIRWTMPRTQAVAVP